MADLILGSGQSVPATTQFRYQDMGDGTYALVHYIVANNNTTNDLLVSSAAALPLSVNIRYRDMSDGTFALVWAFGRAS